MTRFLPNRIAILVALGHLLIVPSGFGTLMLFGQDEEAPTESQFPELDTVVDSVWMHFESEPDYVDGDLISRSQVEPIIEQFQDMGWTVFDRDEILAEIPEDEDYIVRKLSTEKGRRFMRTIAKYPNAYDRLDRLQRIPRGRKLIHEMIHAKGGRKIMKHLTTADGDKNLRMVVGRVPRGFKFKVPTGRILTVERFLERLEEAYHEDQERWEEERMEDSDEEEHQAEESQDPSEDDEEDSGEDEEDGEDDEDDSKEDELS